MWSWAPRVGLAWDVFGDGKTAIRASTGIFYNFVNRSQYRLQRRRARLPRADVRNSTLDDVDDVAAGGQPRREPAARRHPGRLPACRCTASRSPQGELEPETNYQVNLAFQRDIGFNTVAEVAYVANIGRKFWRTKTANNIPINAYAKPNNLFNNEPINANFLRRDYPGLGSISYLTTDDDILNYNAMQVSVQRRLITGLQMGLAYTLSKSEGIQGWDFMTEELVRQAGPARPLLRSAGARRRTRIGGTSWCINYSYMIPNPTPNVPVLKHVLDGLGSVGRRRSSRPATPLDPTCNTNLAGVENNDPVAVRASASAAS